MIEKFALEQDVNVRITNFEFNSMYLAEVISNEQGIDIVITNSIFIEEGLVMETRPNQMNNYNHVAENWRNPDWDPSQRYSVPWRWNSFGISVNSYMSNGDINTSKLFFDPPAVLEGKFNVVNSFYSYRTRNFEDIIT